MREDLSEVIYRQATEADVPAMAKLRAASWGEEGHWRERIRGYMDCEIFPQKAQKARVVYVAAEQDSVVGLIAGHLTRRYECDGELEWIDVAAERRKGGIASQLLRRLAKWFVEQKALRICVDVQPANSVARKFYARHGAQELNPHWMVWNDIKNVLAERE